MKPDINGKIIKYKLAKQNNLSIKVSGDCMVPFLRDGQKVIIENVSREAIRIGDILLIVTNDSLRIHRVVMISGSEIITKGDRAFIFDEIIEDGILGRQIENNSHKYLTSFISKLSWFEGCLYHKYIHRKHISKIYKILIMFCIHFIKFFKSIIVKVQFYIIKIE